MEDKIAPVERMRAAAPATPAFNVYVTRPIPQAGLDHLRKAIGEFGLNRRAETLSKKQLIRRVKGRDGILCLLTDIIDSEVLDAAGPRLKAVSNCAVGVDNIDVAAATRRGVMVTNTPGVLTRATAEMAWALIFACARRVVESDRFLRAGRFRGWDPLLLLGLDVSGKTLGIVGAGRIGAEVAGMAVGFRMNILYHSRSRNRDMERRTGARKVSLAALLRRSDFVSLHVSLNPGTRHMIGRKEIDLMKPSAVLVNTARGPVIDEAALARALRRKRIFAAGLDVFEREPNLAPGLAALENAVLLPHLASATLETRNRMALLAAENLSLALNGKKPHHAVNAEALR